MSSLFFKGEGGACVRVRICVVGEGKRKKHEA